MAAVNKTYYNQAQTEIINGEVVKNDMVKAVYDGDTMTVDVYKNDDHYAGAFDKKNIEHILKKKAARGSLEQRLIADFGLPEEYKLKKPKKDEKKSPKKSPSRKKKAPLKKKQTRKRKY